MQIECTCLVKQEKNNNHCNIDNWKDILSQAVLVFESEPVFGAKLVSSEQSTCSEYSLFVDWCSCWMQSLCLELVCVWYRAGVWRGARFWSRVARAREEFEFGSRNARDILRRTQRMIKPPSFLGYNSDSQLSVSNTSGFEVEDLLISQDNNDRVNVTPTSNGRTGLTQAMQDLQIEDLLPEIDPNLESHNEDIMMEAFGASLDKSTCLDHTI